MLAFGASVERLLAENRLGCDALEAHASPRRLTVLARNVLRRQEDRTVALRGPPVHVAFDDDGNAVDKAYDERIGRFLDEYEWYARALKRERSGGACVANAPTQQQMCRG